MKFFALFAAAFMLSASLGSDAHIIKKILGVKAAFATPIINAIFPNPCNPPCAPVVTKAPIVCKQAPCQVQTTPIVCKQTPCHVPTTPAPCCPVPRCPRQLPPCHPLASIANPILQVPVVGPVVEKIIP